MAGSPRSKKGTTKSPQSPQSPKRKRRGKAVAETKSVDVNNEDYNIRSPERTQFLTQIKRTTKSPGGGRKAKAAAAPETKSVVAKNEDHNIRSPERTQLLTQIKGTIDNAPVSPAFWACCQLADINRLQDIAGWSRQVLLFSEKQVCTLPMQWNQRFRDSALPGSETALRPEGSKRRKLNPDVQPPVPRSATEANNCKERDGYKCVLTRKPDPQEAHIFPHCMLQPRPKPDRNKLSSAIPEFWSSLSLFWDEDRISKWKNTIFPNGVGVESCFNLISLSSETHLMWNKGLFALKPLKLSHDRKRLTVKFFWQVPGNYEIDSRVDLLTEHPSSEGLELVGDYFLGRLEDNRSISHVRSGETFTFTTKDPENLPLPSMELLEMQWVLQRLVGMSGAAGWPSLDDIDDDSVEGEDDWLIADHADYGVYSPPKRVRELVSAEEAVSMTPEMVTPHSSVIECR